LKIITTKFIKSSVTPELCPPADKPEYAFIGRSNVGKSSLINMLTGKTSLAKISSTPGKTQTINHFIINDSWYLVDLPGYGFAKTGKKDKADWMKMINNYISGRPNLMNLFLLIDSRHEPLSNDLSFMAWLGENNIPFSIVFTKTDKLSKTKAESNINAYKARLLEEWEELPINFATSSEKRFGRDEVLSYIENCNKKFLKPQI
jgi:GTP-binding protein